MRKNWLKLQFSAHNVIYQKQTFNCKFTAWKEDQNIPKRRLELKTGP
jgi:hypothetical protein